MSMKNLYVKFITFAIISATIFFLWAHLFPELVLVREQMNIFIWNFTFFKEKLLTIGGFANYCAAFLSQFFYFIKYGVLIYIILFWFLYYACYLLIKRINKHFEHRYTKIIAPLSIISAITISALMLRLDVQLDFYLAIIITFFTIALMPSNTHVLLIAITFFISYWLIGPLSFLILIPQIHSITRGLFLLLTALITIVFSYSVSYYPIRTIFVGVNYIWTNNQIFGTTTDARCDFYFRMSMWKQLSQMPINTAATKHIQEYALLKQNKQYEEKLFTGLADAHQTLTGCLPCFMMSDLCLKLGLVGMSQRAAFEGMVAMPTHQYNARSLKRLAETALITQQFDLAQKYTSVLKQTLFYSKWANDVYQMASQQKISDPNYKMLHDIYQKSDDKFFY